MGRYLALAGLWILIVAVLAAIIYPVFAKPPLRPIATLLGADSLPISRRPIDFGGGLTTVTDAIGRFDFPSGTVNAPTIKGLVLYRLDHHTGTGRWITYRYSPETDYVFTVSGLSGYLGRDVPRFDVQCPYVEAFTREWARAERTLTPNRAPMTVRVTASGGVVHGWPAALRLSEIQVICLKHPTWKVRLARRDEGSTAFIEMKVETGTAGLSPI